MVHRFHQEVSGDRLQLTPDPLGRPHQGGRSSATRAGLSPQLRRRETRSGRSPTPRRSSKPGPQPPAVSSFGSAHRQRPWGRSVPGRGRWRSCVRVCIKRSTQMRGRPGSWRGAPMRQAGSQLSENRLVPLTAMSWIMRTAWSTLLRSSARTRTTPSPLPTAILALVLSCTLLMVDPPRPWVVYIPRRSAGSPGAGAETRTDA